MAVEDVTIGPMTEDFVLWRCLHGGPLTRESIEVLPTGGSADTVDWSTRRAINVPLLTRLIQTYGTCAMLARDGDSVVGFLRSYPKAIAGLHAAGQLCLQQAHPNGPTATLVDEPFPPLQQLADKTLLVHCLMTGSVHQKENPYQRRGLAKRMVQELARWGREHGWHAIETDAFEDLAALYALSGGCGRHFWERLGFVVVAKSTEPAESFPESLLATMRQQAVAMGLSVDDTQNLYTMRLELCSSREAG